MRRLGLTSLMPSAPSAPTVPLGACSSPPEPEESDRAMELPWFVSHCLETAAFWESTSNRELQERYWQLIFYWILSLKKAPVRSMSITLKHASFRTNHFLSPSFITQILRGELHWLPVLLSSKHWLRSRTGMGGKCLSSTAELETVAASPRSDTTTCHHLPSLSLLPELGSVKLGLCSPKGP